MRSLTPSEMAELEGDRLWRAVDIVETLRRSFGRIPTGQEVLGAVRPLPSNRHPGYVHLRTALRTAEGAT